MPQYANKFLYISNQNKSEINLYFFHEYPNPPQDADVLPEVLPTQTDVVAQLILTTETVQELLRILNKALNENQTQ